MTNQAWLSRNIRSAHLILPCLFLIVLISCEQESAPSPHDAAVIFAVTETEPVRSAGDAADDPAIWVNVQNPSDSRVIGTDKQSGIEVYDLNGGRVQFIPAGLTNNIDLRSFSEDGEWSALAAASNRTGNTISLFLIDRAGTLTWLQDSEIATGLAEVYGLCMFRNDQGMQVFVNDTDGRFQQWSLSLAADEKTTELLQFHAELLREFVVPSKPEGCVADDAEQRLFLGVEEMGIFVLSARHDAPADLQAVMEIEGTVLSADVEGMALYLSGNVGYLLVSSQGNNSYAIFDRLPPFSYRGSFEVADRQDGLIDGAEETDGVDVASVSLGPAFPEGIIVVQDGINQLPRESQDFKYLSWRDIAIALGLH
ncbi:MAG: phytase [Gammaproteobacteria bacterium]|nr:phytase [Gammaproteobacteria bacterium]